MPKISTEASALGGRLRVTLAVWVVLVTVGAFASVHVATKPAMVEPAPSDWPDDSSLSLSATRPTLVAFLHPECPCSRATLAELDRLLSRSAGKVDAQLVFVHPAGASDDWKDSDLRRIAAGMNDVVVLTDESGVEAKRFHATTSGEAFLFAPNGVRMFRGGITWARGHEGDSQGSSILESLIVTGEGSRAESPVFGCPLLDE